jgi:hypothetical protein
MTDFFTLGAYLQDYDAKIRCGDPTCTKAQKTFWCLWAVLVINIAGKKFLSQQN